MIITRLRGGLGNQMFQYAAGLALAEHRNTVQQLDVSWFREYPGYEAHNRYRLSCFNVTEYFAAAADIASYEAPVLGRVEQWALSVARMLHLHRYVRAHTQTATWHQPATGAYYDGFFQLPDGTGLDGYFQSEKFFAPVAPLLRQHFSFRYPPTDEVAELAIRIRSRPSVALHFRRGDYARNPSFAKEMGVIGLDYYHRALALLRQRSPDAVAYIFSDDIEGVAAEFKPAGPHEFVRCVKAWHPHDKIRLMAMCEHIAIANSSFSWWGAWLNPSPTKLVITPAPWFTASPSAPADILPAGWTTIPRNS